MEDDRFYVKSLTLENFRCFEKLELNDLDPHFNLLVGENGAGKSSILLGLADMFRWLGDQAREEGPRRLINLNDMRFEHVVSTNGVVTQRSHPNVAAEAKLQNGATEQKIESFGLDNSHVLSYNPIPNGARPLIAFYRTDRIFRRPVSAEISRMRFRRRREHAYTDWDQAGVSSDELREWLKTETLAFLQDSLRRADLESSKIVAKFQPFPLVAKAINDAVPKARLVNFDADLDDIVFEIGHSRRYEFSQMSDGQRAFIGLVADIARRSCVLNSAFFGDETLLKTPGLVLIDEIDLHLHPKWQRQIVSALKKIFPKIQFFATTHSPQVIGEARPEEIVLLTKDGQQKRPMASYGMDSNWILECVMEAEGRDPEIAKKVKRLYDSIEDGEFEAARKLITELRRTVGNFGDVEAAESYMWRAEHEGDEAAE